MREQTAEVSAPIEQEFLSVIREYERVIYKVCYLYANPNAPLNDLYQDVVLNLWKAYPKFRKECKVSTWIYRIALNTCISFYRKEKNVPEIVSLTRDTDWAIEAHDPINEMLKQLYQMINQLGQLDKSIILLYLEDKSYEERAEITGLTVTNVATKLSRIKDKEFIKEEELEKLIRHADKGIHAIARLNIKLILISLPILILFLAEVLLHNRLNPIYIIIIFAWIPALCWDIVTTRFLQRTQIDEMPLVEVISRVNRIHRWTIRERLIAIAFLLVLAILSFIYWQVWQYGMGMIAFFILLWGGGLGLILWIYRKKFLNRIHEIKKNLSELNELM